jgi:hypothetical protein
MTLTTSGRRVDFDGIKIPYISPLFFRVLPTVCQTSELKDTYGFNRYSENPLRADAGGKIISTGGFPVINGNNCAAWIAGRVALKA